jgi:protein TonB
MREASPNRWPAATASAVLHASLLAAMLFAWFSHPIKLSSVVPVTLVTSDQASQPSEAIAAPTPQTAQTETPTPEATPQAAAPEPQPQPAPAPPAKPVPSKPTPTKQEAKPAPSTFDPDAELASLSKTLKAPGAKTSSAKRGPARPSTAVQARLTTGAGDAVSASALTSLAATLQRLWNPNCEVAGSGDLDIRVTFRLSASGRLVGSPQSSGDNAPESSVVRVASDRAKRAVYAADANQAFDSLPPNLYGQPITVKFNGQAACAQG